jgi:hypothetical protein
MGLLKTANSKKKGRETEEKTSTRMRPPRKDEVGRRGLKRKISKRNDKNVFKQNVVFLRVMLFLYVRGLRGEKRPWTSILNRHKMKVKNGLLEIEQKYLNTSIMSKIS